MKYKILKIKQIFYFSLLLELVVIVGVLSSQATAATIPDTTAQWILGSRSDGLSTPASFAFGVTPDSGQTFSTTLESWQDLDLLADIKVAAEDVGQNASLFLVAQYNNAFFMKNTRGEWQTWDLSLAHLVPALTLKLDELSSVKIQEQLTDLPGNFSLWVGYKVNDLLIYNAQPFNFTVIPKEKPTNTCTGACLTQLFIPENSFGQATPPDAKIVPSDEFIQGVKNGSLILSGPKILLDQLREREADYQKNLAELKTLETNPYLSTLLESASKTINPFLEPVLTLSNGQQVQLLSLSDSINQAVIIQKLAQSPENALNNYQRSYDFLPDNLKNDAPTVASLQGKSVTEIKQALGKINSILSEHKALFDDSAIAPDTILPKLKPGNGKDNSGITNPTELYARFSWPLKSFLTPVKNQGSRGTCWAFATIAALESRELVQKDTLHDLSEQYLIKRAKLNWHPTAYGDGYGYTNVIDRMINKNEVLPEENFWTYNPSPKMDLTMGISNEARYKNACSDYSGSCSPTAHQSEELTCTNIPIPTPGSPEGKFCAYEDIKFQGAGVAANKLVPIWTFGETFDGERYATYLLNGYTILADFGVRIGFSQPDRGFVTDDTDAGYRGQHQVLIVGFISNTIINSYNANLGVGGVPLQIPGGLPASGGFFVIKNSWGNTGDGGYYYVSAEYIKKYFSNLSILEMGTARSDRWSNGSLTIKLTEGNQLNADLRISKKLFEVIPPRNKKINDVSIQVNSSVASDQIKLSSSFGEVASYTGYFSTTGPRSVQVTARVGNASVQQTFNVDVINTAPTIELLPPPAIFQKEITTLTVALKDINETNPGAMCSRVTWSFTAPDVPYSADGSCTLTVAFGNTADGKVVYRSFVVSTTDSEGLRTNQTFTIPVYPPLENPYPKITDAWLHEPDRLIGRDVDAVCQTGIRIPSGTAIDLTKPESSYACGGSTPEPTVTRPYEVSVNVENPSNETLTYRWHFYWVDTDNINHTLENVQGSSTYIIPRIPLGSGGKPFSCGVDVIVASPDITRYRFQTVWTGQCIFPDLVPR